VRRRAWWWVAGTLFVGRRCDRSASARSTRVERLECSFSVVVVVRVALGALAVGDPVPLRAVGTLDLGEHHPRGALGALVVGDPFPFGAVGALRLGERGRHDALGVLGGGDEHPAVTESAGGG
jgi:hypothetical protein